MTEAKIQNEEGNNETGSKGKEPVLAKYVRKYHTSNQIIGDKYDGTMTRRNLKGTFLLAKFEPRSVKDVLENEN